jgi:hypothetical protein
MLQVHESLWTRMFYVVCGAQSGYVLQNEALKVLSNENREGWRLISIDRL